MPSPADTRILISNQLQDVFGISPFQRYGLLDPMDRLPRLVATVEPGGAYAQAGLQQDLRANFNLPLLAGTGSVDANAAFATNGGVTLTTTNGANNVAVIGPSNFAAGSPSAWFSTLWNTSKSPRFQAVVAFPAAATARSFLFGAAVAVPLAATELAAGLGADACAIAFDPASAVSPTRFRRITRVGGITTDTGPNVGAASPTQVVLADTLYVLDIELGPDRQPLYRVNGDLLGSGPTMTANANLLPFVYIRQTTVATPSVNVRAVQASRLF